MGLNLQGIFFSHISETLRRQLEDRSGGRLPTHGFLAGGAVANLILAATWQKEYPVNDLDIFEGEIDPLPLSSRCPFRCTRYELDESYRKPRLVRSGYRVLRTERDGMLNRITIRKTLPAFGDARHMMVLNGFDLNCCQAGIDLESGNLYWTPAFETFLRDGQLRVSSPVTPMHTAIRLAKKQEELGCYCSVQEELALLSSYHEACIARNEQWAVATCFGAKYGEMFNHYKEQLSPFCTMTQTTAAVLPGLENDMGTLYRLDFQGVEQCHSAIQKILGNGPGFDSNAFVSAYHHLFRSSTPLKIKQKFSSVMSFGSVPALCTTMNSATIDGNMSTVHFEVLERFASMHPGCMKVIIGFGLSLYNQVQAIRLIRKRANKHGDIIYGLIETAHMHGAKLTEISEHSIDMLLEIYQSLGNTSLVEPLDLTDSVWRGDVRELTSKADLKIEGSRMRHCVGGYSPILASGNMRIFHIDTHDGMETTAAIYLQNKQENQEMSFGVQIYGRKNSDPPDYHCNIADALGQLLMETIWKSEEDLVPGFVDIEFPH